MSADGKKTPVHGWTPDPEVRLAGKTQEEVHALIKANIEVMRDPRKARGGDFRGEPYVHWSKGKTRRPRRIRP
jgi:hypothetical protein